MEFAFPVEEIPNEIVCPLEDLFLRPLKTESACRFMAVTMGWTSLFGGQCGNSASEEERG